MVSSVETNKGFGRTIANDSTKRSFANAAKNTDFKKILQDICESDKTTVATLNTTAASDVSVSEIAVSDKNSREIANAVEKNLNWILDASSPEKARYGMNVIGEKFQLEYFPPEMLENNTNWFKDIMAKFVLTKYERITISQDKYGKITVTIEDTNPSGGIPLIYAKKYGEEVIAAINNAAKAKAAEKAKEIEELLNSNKKQLTGIRAWQQWVKEIGQEEYDRIREAKWNEYFTNEFENLLSKNGIVLSGNEKFNISVDKYCKVSVTGDNEEKAKKIEKLLNSMPDGENWGLILNRNGVYDFDDLKPQLLKTLAANYIENASGAAISLDELYVENGRIMGLPIDLNELINSIEPDPYYKAKKSIEANYEYKLNAMLEMLRRGDISASEILSLEEEIQKFIKENPNAKSYDIKSVLMEILTIGANNISDLTANIVVGKGSIVWG
ncbi:MAG: hypothetical protein FWF51_01410 [Chitinivibrionia bacterium]|nr:hypothetical protein [Chitinivibrionia bacterium]